MRAQLRELSRAPDAGWWVRERVDMVLLAAKGWSAPLIAQHLGCSDKTVRRVLRAFEAKGVEALEWQSGITLEVVKRSDKDFVVQARRWVVERTFGWLNRERRLSKDYERKEESSEAFIHLGMTRLMLRRLA